MASNSTTQTNLLWTAKWDKIRANLSMVSLLPRGKHKWGTRSNLTRSSWLAAPFRCLNNWLMRDLIRWWIRALCQLLLTLTRLTTWWTEGFSTLSFKSAHKRKLPWSKKYMKRKNLSLAFSRLNLRKRATPLIMQQTFQVQWPKKVN